MTITASAQLEQWSHDMNSPFQSSESLNQGRHVSLLGYCGAAMAGWAALEAPFAIWVFLFPHGPNFAPEIGPAATFAVFALANTIGYLALFIFLAVPMRILVVRVESTVAERLTRFLEYPELELSTNLAENSMRPVALGRKNWLHIGSPQAGAKVAAILSVVESCRRLKVPVRDYFSAILPGLADLPIKCLPALTPGAWVARHS